MTTAQNAATTTSSSSVSSFICHWVAGGRAVVAGNQRAVDVHPDDVLVSGEPVRQPPQQRGYIRGGGRRGHAGILPRGRMPAIRAATIGQPLSYDNGLVRS
jgi:hypothetical protein